MLDEISPTLSKKKNQENKSFNEIDNISNRIDENKVPKNRKKVLIESISSSQHNVSFPYEITSMGPPIGTSHMLCFNSI